MTIELLTEHHLEFLSIKGGDTGSYEPTRVKMSHCWKSHVTAQFYSCPIEIIKRLTDKGQFQYLIGLKGPQERIYLSVCNTIYFTNFIK